VAENLLVGFVGYNLVIINQKKFFALTFYLLIFATLVSNLSAVEKVRPGYLQNNLYQQGTFIAKGGIDI